MSYRQEFSAKTRKKVWARADGICECGCGRAFSNHPKEHPHYDHILAAYLGGDNRKSNCQVIRIDCHNAKTVKDDMPRIKKVRREKKRQTNTQAIKRKIPGSKGTGMRKCVDGSVVRLKYL
jgi:5-methylcytosine-specific restriction protein A